MSTDQEPIGEYPTDEQIEGIERRTKEIQESWSDDERMRRAGKPRKRWKPPEYQEGALP